MKDSILKGTGNSRFLKSAIPDGTTWAEALAMLRAGTFPMDLNGINNAGFQQVGTPLNKANLLKDVNALTLGLTGDAVLDDMFSVLAHAGDLHVWKKTVVTKAEVPASFALGEVHTGSFRFVAAGYNTLLVGTPTVDDAGNVSLLNTQQYYFNYNSSSPSVSDLRGKYCMFAGIDDTYSNFTKKKVFYIPSDANYISVSSSKNITKYQDVNGTPAIPAGTTATYPVSTNRNAYQEGNAAKPAGYTLGEVVTGRFMLEGYFNSSHPTYYIADTKPTVTDDGIVSVNDVYGFDGYNGDKQQLQTLIRGKYIKCRVDDYTSSDFRNLGVVYIPEDTVVLQNSSVEGTYIDRYQPVTGYAAIPTNTTIEYLGCLGDKARLQVGSYVGTGTHGSSNPCSITANFKIKFAVITNAKSNSSDVSGTAFFLPFALNENYTKHAYAMFDYDSGDQNQYNNAKKSKDGKTLYWYNQQYASAQMNVSSRIYFYVLFG